MKKKTIGLFTLLLLIMSTSVMAEDDGHGTPRSASVGPMKTIVVYSLRGYKEAEVPFPIVGPGTFSETAGAVIEICDAVLQTDGSYRPDRTKCQVYSVTSAPKTLVEGQP